MNNFALRALSNEELRSRVDDLVRQGRENIVDLIIHLMEVDRRDAALDWGFSSTFAYCRQSLGFSEQATYARIRVARAARRFPQILERLREGKLHLEAITRLAPVLTEENSAALIRKAEGATTIEVKSLVAGLQKLPAPKRDVVTPLPPPERRAEPLLEAAVSVGEVLPELPYRFSFTADGELLRLVDRLRGFLRHKFPSGRLEDIFIEACSLLLTKLERDHFPAGRKSESSTKRARKRRVPAAVKREVWARDRGLCTFKADDGRVCGSSDGLEYDHIKPWADGGDSDDPANIRLLCRAHNQRLGRKRFGDWRKTRNYGQP